MKSGIYKIENTVNKNFYIGSTIDFAERWKRHRIYLRKNKHSNRHLQGAWNAYGEDKFIFIELENCEIEKLLEREQFYMDTLKPQYNIRIVAESNRGLVGSEEMKKKMSELMKGRIFTQEWKDKISKSKIGNKAFLGKHHTQEAKDKVSNAKKGIRPSENTYTGLANYNKDKVVSKETREKLSASGKGRIVSQETKDKMSVAAKGRKHSEETKIKLSNSSKGNKNSLGKPVPKERRDKISKTLKLRNILKRITDAIRQE